MKIEPISFIEEDGTLVVSCTFLQLDGTKLTRMLPVEQSNYELRPVVVNGEVVGEEIYVFDGYVTLHDKRERFLCAGTPPFLYHENLATPIKL